MDRTKFMGGSDTIRLVRDWKVSISKKLERSSQKICLTIYKFR